MIGYMIPELGHYSLILALALSLIQIFIPMIGASKNRVGYMQCGRYCAFGQTFFIGLSFLALAFAFINNDFSIRYVAENSNSHLPLIYRFCAVWGAHEGSLLLWVLILSFWTTAVSLFSKNLPLTFLSRILSILAIVSTGFYLFLLLTSDPFQRLIDVPLNGRDLNPLLQDPGLIIHPPMLYMGYVGFSVAFAFAIAALISGELNSLWARWTRPWTLIAWCFLTYGIVAGSWWAYRELGWGGWWFWDPVENASFLPWLSGTALIHCLIVTEKRNAFKAWTAFMAICSFALSLLGTFLVRSGILISVHSFAVDPKRGQFLLAYLMLIVGGSLGVYAWRARTLKTNLIHFSYASRESFLLFNNLILFVAMLTVLLGTLYPLLIDSIGLEKISVGYPYFNAVFIPLTIPLLFLMGIGPQLHWEYTQKSILNNLIRMLIFVAILALFLPLLAHKPFKWIVSLMLLLSFWVAFNALVQWVDIKKMKFKSLPLSRWAMVLAHIGVAITIIGITLTSSYSEEKNLSMQVGDRVTVGPYQFKLEGLSNLEGPNYQGVIAKVMVYEKNHVMTILYPEQRVYDQGKIAKAKTDISAGIFRDLYVALGIPLEENSWSMRIYYKPFIRWIWGGGILMLLGGLVGALDRRFRKKNLS